LAEQKDEEKSEIGHNKEVIDQLYKNTKGVKTLLEKFPTVVTRIE